MSSFRITTNGLFRNYRTNLTKNNQKLNKAMIGVETQRKFNSYAEDPAAASRAWRLRRSFWRTNDQIGNNNYLVSKYESTYTAMSAIVDGDVGNGEYGLGLDGILSAIEGVSGQSGASRTALGKQLVQEAQNMVSVMNTRYGDEFVFAGADGLNAPFAWEGDKLLYRGVDVGTEEAKMPDDFGLTGGENGVLETYGLTSRALGADYNKDYINLEKAELEKPLTMEEFKESDYYATAAGADDEAKYESYKADYLARNQSSTEENTVKLKETDPSKAFTEARKLYEKLESFQNYAKDYHSRTGVSYETGAGNYAKLQSMADETTYVDIGLGMKEDEDGKLIPGSAFNSAVSGLNFLGYGADKNLVLIVRELGEIFSRADPDSGKYEDEEADSARADELLDRLHEAVRYSQDQHTQLTADAKYLRTNLKQLETNRDELDKQIVDTEDYDMADAITNMGWAQYCYNAALRIGTNILSQSLIDYMG